MKRIMVIGATGYVGRYLCPYLKSKGYDVLALGRSKKIESFFKEHRISFQYFDLDNDDCFSSIESDFDAIVDLSAKLAEHETPVKEFFDVNTIGAYKTLEFARENGIKKVVITTSHKVYNDVDYNNKPIPENVELSFTGDHTPYIISKIAAENFVSYYNKDFGMSAIALRLTGVHGYGEILGKLNADGTYIKSSFEIFFEKALKGETIEVWGDQKIKRDHIYIKDVLSAIEAAINAEDNVKGIFNIASGVAYSQYEEAVVLADVFAKGMVSNVILCPEKQGLKRGYIYDISKAERELKWKPRFTSLRDVYEDYKKEWEKKEYHNYHNILEDQRPLTF